MSILPRRGRGPIGSLSIDVERRAKALVSIRRYKPTGRVLLAGRPSVEVNEIKLEVVSEGARCDWAIGGVYEHLGMIEVREYG